VREILTSEHTTLSSASIIPTRMAGPTMKKQTSFIFAVATVLLSATGIVSAGQGGDPTSDTYAYCGGAGWLSSASGENIQLEASADQKSDGVDGQINVMFGGGPKVKARVTCMTVSGHYATLTGIVYFPAALEGETLVLDVYDGDNDGSADAAAVAMGDDTYVSETDSACSMTDIELAPLSRGNFSAWGAW
jgi:hypothetical protein